ncbi:calcium-binding protein [Paracoccus salsus]|uniref:calcium-binding protein n=1 Tax=Paracoccus salsus TaxID=2911061 RepID=UPI001F313992|nr:calcium-binding protein [Paracoccus salsus]MCF3972641.1 calcium-binding protein [Paracoccus salsus]
MLMLAGLMGLLVAGMAVDMTSLTSNTPESDPDDDMPVNTGDDDVLPPVMPDPDDYPDPRSGDGATTDSPASPPPADKPDTSVEGPTGLPGAGGAGIADHDGLTGGNPASTGFFDGTRIVGSDLVDLLKGGAGNDLIMGYGGDDDLRGGLGADTIYGGDGDDWVQGDGDYGPGGNDVLLGGHGNDLLMGQGGDDLIFGEAGNDTIFGGEGNDTLHGGEGDDWLSGNDGDDVLISGGGSDDLDGGRGDDVLIGANDPATVWMHGGEGNDTLMPGSGDFAEGGAGEDRFVLQPDGGVVPIIADFSAAEDVIHLHLPADMAGDAVVDLREDLDGTTLITLNGEAVARLLHLSGLRAEDILIVRAGDGPATP